MKMKLNGTLCLMTLFVFFPLLFTACDDKNNTTPTALFSISPSFGTVDSTFRFDATESRDLEDPGEELQVRWDWESDSIFDTDFTTVKTAEHKFATGGTYYITLEVMDSKGLTARKTDFVKVGWNNRAPNASFVVLPEAGYLQDVFIYDASSCSDPEDDNRTLRVRWDFDGDGIWDTEYNTVKVAEHQYDEPGSYEVRLEVVDSQGLTGLKTYVLEVQGMNSAPEPPQIIAPGSGSNTVSTRCVLEWSCTDPDGDPLLFDIYFGEGSNPPKIAGDVEGFSYLNLPLDFSTDYTWKIVAKDPYGHAVSGELWSFRTWDPDFEMGVVRDPRNGNMYKTVEINGKLWMAQNMDIGTMIHASTGGDFGDGYQKNNEKTEKYCYQNKADNCAIYGGLYQWDEAMGYSEVQNAEGICIPGWHVPSADEWIALINYFRDDLGVSAGTNLVWGSKSGFEMLFSGYLIFAERKYYDVGQAGYAWSSTINPSINHLSMGRSVFNGLPDLQEDTFQRVSALPVRCIKDY